ncbi:hypothetical protein F4803DRAFT_514294 [Xylaria telfairii]|nr:hypothetical protein F4803DRAFT_514294 [Xylaria telfairii]
MPYDDARNLLLHTYTPELWGQMIMLFTCTHIGIGWTHECSFLLNPLVLFCFVISKALQSSNLGQASGHVMLYPANSTAVAFDNSILCLKPRGIGEIQYAWVASTGQYIFGIHRSLIGSLFEFGGLHSISVLFGLDANDVPVSLMRLTFTSDSSSSHGAGTGKPSVEYSIFGTIEAAIQATSTEVCTCFSSLGISKTCLVFEASITNSERAL